MFKRSHLNWEILFVFFSICLYVIAACLVSLHRYWQVDAFWFDFGIFDQMIWKLSRFQLPILPALAPPLGKIGWADHFSPSLIVLVPLYWITSASEIILIAQAVFVGLGALVAYAISRKLVVNPLVRIALIVSYLGFVGMQNALYTDVHNIVFATLPLMLTLWALYEKRWRWYWFFLLLTFGFQESLATVGIGIGLFLLLKKGGSKKIGLLTVCVSILWLVLVTKAVIPYFNHGPYRFAPVLPATAGEWITNFFIPASLKLRTIILTFTTFGFLPLFAISTWPLIIQQFLERFVLNTAATRWDLGFHYNAILSPIMFLGALEVILWLQHKPKFSKWLTFWAGITVLIVVYLHRFYLHGPLMLSAHPVFYDQTRRAEFLHNFVSQIPTKGLVMTQNNFAAYLKQANVILLSLDIKNLQPDVVALDMRPGQNANNFYPLTPADVEKLHQQLELDPHYEKTSITDSQLIYTLHN